MKERGRLTLEELLELKWLMGGLLGLLALWSLFSLRVGIGPFLALGVVVVAAALLRPHWVRRIPQAAVRWAGPVVFTLIAADFVLNIPRFPEFLPPLVRMIVLLLIYRILAPRGKREDRQLILLCLFCLIISGVLTVSLLFALQILLFTPAAMALLFVICLLDRGTAAEEAAPRWTHFSWPRLARRVWAVLDLKVLCLGASMFAFVVLVSSLLFVLTPRINLDRAIPFLEIGGTARSGFSETVGLGEVTEIREDDGVAFRVDVPSPDALERSPYWRMLVLDEYEAGGFRMSASLRRAPLRDRANVREVYGWGAAAGPEGPEQWTFYMEGGISRYLPLPGPYRVLRFQGFQDVERIKELRLLATDVVRQSVLFFQVDDLEPANRLPAAGFEVAAFSERPPPPAPAAAEGAGPAYPQTARSVPLEPAELDVLDRINGEIGSLAEPADAARYAQAATDYLRSRFRYSLRPDAGRGEGDPVVRWLTDGSRGHCEFFAGSFVLLARRAGFPARMVVGFAGGSWNSVEEYFVVRNRDAHAWVEIYDARTREWLRVDPTPGSGSSDPDAAGRRAVGFEVGWTAWIDSLRIQWYRRIVNFDQEDQVSMVESLGEVWRESLAALKARVGRWTEALRELARAPLGESGFRLALLGLGLGGAVWLVWRARFRLWRGIARLPRRSRRMDPVRKQAGRYLRKLREREAADGEGARRAELARIRGEVERLRFGPESTVPAARAVFRRVRRLLRARR